MARPKAPCGTYAAYRRHLREDTEVCNPCRAAQRLDSKTRSHSAEARRAKQEAVKPAAEPDTASVEPAVETPEGHVSRLETLKEMLQQSRELVEVLKRNDSNRAYLQMREQREILRELAEIQGNGQSTKGATLADQLAAARAEREQREAARTANA